MNLLDFPRDIQHTYLINLDPSDILSYCSGSVEMNNNICQSDSFWNQKAINDFGYPIYVLFNQSPYWKYRLAQNLILNESYNYLSALIRNKNFVLANKFADKAINVDNKLPNLVYEAIEADDIDTLKFLKAYILKVIAPEDTYYSDNIFWNFLEHAFKTESAHSVKFFMGIYPNYFQDLVILDELFTTLIDLHKDRGLELLKPYIEQSIMDDPDILDVLDGILSDGSLLKEYIEKNFVKAI